MQILIACAKIMTGTPPRRLPQLTTPAYAREAARMAHALARYSVDELQQILRVGRPIACENRLRYMAFDDESLRVPAVFAYDGMVYKKLAPETWSDADLLYANSHLYIASFLYGLLRPLDVVSRYRLEGDVVLPCNGHLSVFDYWKPILTDNLIASVKADDGILVNLAAGEFRSLFDWRRVTKEVTVLSPRFMVARGDRLATVTVYAKMCRGAMSRWLIQERIALPGELPAFTYEGFAYAGDMTFVQG